MEYDIGFVGLGYVGLSTAVCFSNRRMKVIGIEIDTNKIISDLKKIDVSSAIANKEKFVNSENGWKVII